MTGTEKAQVSRAQLDKQKSDALFLAFLWSHFDKFKNGSRGFAILLNPLL